MATEVLTNTRPSSGRRSFKNINMPKWKSVSKVFRGKDTPKLDPLDPYENSFSSSEDERSPSNSKAKRRTSLMKKIKKSKSVSSVIKGVKKGRKSISRRLSKQFNMRSPRMEEKSSVAPEELSVVTMDFFSAPIKTDSSAKGMVSLKNIVLVLYLLCSVGILGWQASQTLSSDTIEEERYCRLDAFDMLKFAI